MAQVGYIDENGRNILWSIPTPPPNFLNISSSTDHNGIYILGQVFFKVRNIHVTNIFKRNLFGTAEDFVLGAISVLLIAVLSEIVQAVLMHTRKNRKPTRRGLQVAYLVDELFHFRHLVSRVFKGKDARKNLLTVDRESSKIRTLTGLTVILIAVSLMAADVFAVYLTQPSRVGSYRHHQYNLRGIQPIASDHGLSKWVNRLSRERTCVTPAFTEGQQKRKFVLSICFMFSFHRGHDSFNDTISEVNVTSFYHIGGSDHTVQFGNASIKLMTRTLIYVNDDNYLEREAFVDRINFATNDSKSLDFTKYIHELFIYSAMEFNCNQENWVHTCAELVNAVTREHEIVERNIFLWEGRENDEYRTVKGVRSTYTVPMNNPFETYIKGIAALTTTSAIVEAEGPGTYSSVKTENALDDIPGLLEEEGRVAGLLALLSILGVSFLILITLRVTLKPASLGGLAWEAEFSEVDRSSSRCLDKRVGTMTSHSSMFLDLPDVEEIRESHFRESAEGTGTSQSAEEEKVREGRGELQLEENV